MMTPSCNPSRPSRSVRGREARPAHSASVRCLATVGAVPPLAGPLYEPAPSNVGDVHCVPRHSGAPTPAGDRSARTGLHVLVVDDEAGIRNSLRRMLGRRHRVETAGNGREAFERLVSGQCFDVILCDLTMPEMTGVQLYEALTTEAPGTTGRIVFMTGGVFSEHTRDFLERVSNPLLEKPLSLESLRLAFHVVLERTGQLGAEDGRGD